MFPLDYSSIKFVKCKKYSIEDTEIEITDIKDIFDEIKDFTEEPEISFPQADSFERVINLCELLAGGAKTKNEITENDKVETTGMGGVFPKGILVGNVYDKKIDEDGVSIIVRVKLSGNIKGDNYVAVLQRNEMGS